MRNLKKILALVLALVMSLSLMATASAAGTTAAAETDAYATAKEVLEGLKVFKGDAGTGNMRYTDPISRVETAALVYRICTGDVEDAKAGLHTNHPFKDVASDFWGTSYISYGHNAGILKGKGANNFDPFANVTGYETLAMMLRAMGYGRNGEFEGAGWEVRTASTAQSLGLLKNVTPSDSARLGQPASRELVAEILFRAILKNKVMFSALNPYNYTELNEKLADNLALTEVKGVVIANEYANLDTASTLGAGKTLLRGEKDYTISKSTDLDAIGESRLAYLQNGTTVLAISDGKAENKTAETTDAKKLDALLGDAGLSAPAQSGKFINFGKGTGCYSEYKIQYVLKYTLDADGKAKADLAAERINYAAGTTITPAEKDGFWTVTRTITPKSEITSVDLGNMSTIFGKADRTDKDVWTTIADGEVYVGTQSYEDISDNLKYSYDKFYSEFILERKDTDFSANENGNWMKVIDNDLDGKADYALKVIYTFAQVTAAKDGAYTLDVKNHTLDTPAGVCGIDKINNVTSETVVSNSGELAVGDIVYYANIDGKVQAYKAEMKTVSFNDVNRNNKTAVTTDGETLTQSGVCEHISDAAYESGVVNLAGKVSYDIYLDRGGYLGAFTKTTATGQFKLVTDGWYNSVKVGTDYAIKVYNDETGRQDTIDIPNNGSLFIGSGRTDNNAWGALKSLPSLNDSKQHKNLTTGSYVNDDTVRTTVVALASDNSILPVEDGSVAGRYDHVMIDLSNASGGSFIPTRTPVTGNAYITTTGSQTAYNHNNGPVELRALTSTVYYLVYRDQANGAYQVTRTVGYDSAPDVTALAKKGYVEDIYAVGTRHVTNNDLTGATAFYTADVVVIELNQYDYHNELIMVVDDEARLTDVRYRDLTVIRADGTTGNLTIDYSASMLHDYGYIDGKAGQKIVEPGLYWLYKTSTEGIYTISKRLDANQIAASGHIAAGQVKQYDYINGQEYVALRSFTTDNLDLIHNTRGANYNAAAVIDNTVETTYTLTSDIPMYTLSYNVGHDDTLVAYRTSGKASLTSTTHSTALAGQVNIVPRDNVNTADREGTDSANWNRYNYNDVMIFFNGSRAVYAVSFENIRTDNGGIKNGTTWNFAQTVWENVLPSKHVYTTVAPEVHLFGETGPALTAGVTTPIPYSVWSKFDVAGTDVPVTVFARPAVSSNNEIAVEGSTGWSDTAVTVSDLLDTDRTKLAVIASGLTDSINVQSRAKTGGAVSQNWNFGYYLVPANDDATLRYEDGREVPNPIPDTQEIGNLRSFIEKHKVPAGATATWNVTDNISGETYTIVVTDDGIDESRTNLPKNISFMHEVKDFYVKVVAENGVTEKEYSENAPAPAPQVTFTVKNATITVDDNPVADGEKVTAQVGDVLTIKVTPVPATNDTITVKANGTAVTDEEDGSYKVTVTGDMAVSVETSDSAAGTAWTITRSATSETEWDNGEDTPVALEVKVPSKTIPAGEPLVLTPGVEFTDVKLLVDKDDPTRGILVRAYYGAGDDDYVEPDKDTGVISIPADKGTSVELHFWTGTRTDNVTPPTGEDENDPGIGDFRMAGRRGIVTLDRPIADPDKEFTGYYSVIGSIDVTTLYVKNEQKMNVTVKPTVMSEAEIEALGREDISTWYNNNKATGGKVVYVKWTQLANYCRPALGHGGSVTPPEPEGLLQYRAVGNDTSTPANSTSYEFYGYGYNELVKLSETEAKTALAAALSADRKISLTAEDIQFSTDGTKAWYNKNGTDYPVSISSDEKVAGSWKFTKRLYKISFAGEPVYYAYPAEANIKIELDADYVVVDAGAAGGTDTPEAVTKGVLTHTFSGTSDENLVSVIKVAIGNITSWAFENKADGTPNWNANTGGWVKPGTTVSVSGVTASMFGASIENDGKYRVSAGNTEVPIAYFTGKEVLANANSTYTEFKAVGALTAENTVDGLATLSGARVYDVQIDDTPVGTYAINDDVSVDTIEGLEEDDVMIMNRANGADYYWNILNYATTPSSGYPFVIVEVDDGEKIITLNTHLEPHVSSDKTTLNLYRATLIDTTDSFIDSVECPDGAKSGTLSGIKGKFFVREDATVNLKSSVAGKIFRIEIDDADPVDCGAFSTNETTYAFDVNGASEITVSEITGVNKLWLNIVDGAVDKTNDSNQSVTKDSTLLKNLDLSPTQTMANVGTSSGFGVIGSQPASFEIAVTSSDMRLEVLTDGTYTISIKNLTAADGYSFAPLKDGAVEIYMLCTANYQGAVVTWTILTSEVVPNDDGTVNITLVGTAAFPA